MSTKYVIWPDGTVCEHDELEEFSWKSDDYIITEVLRFQHNGNYTITLEPGYKSFYMVGGEHDEGYSSTQYTFQWLDDMVICRHEHESRDCDGPYESERIMTCPVDLILQAMGTGEDLTWTVKSQSQRDYYAEQMGY